MEEPQAAGLDRWVAVAHMAAEAGPDRGVAVACRAAEAEPVAAHTRIRSARCMHF